MKKLTSLLIALCLLTNPIFASSTQDRRPFPYGQGVALAKNVLYLNARELSAGAGLNTLWSDTFKDATQINAASSSDYTARGAANYDVIVNTSTTPESNATENDSYEFFSNFGTTDRGVGQTFQASASYSITGFKLKLSENGTPDMVAKGAIYATSGGLPTGAALAETTNITVNGNFSAHPTLALYTFTFQSPVAITSGTTYALVVERVSGTPSGANNCFIRIQNTNVVTGAFIGKNGSDVWATIGTSDAVFETIKAAATSAVVRSVTTTFGSPVSEVMPFADVTLNTGSISLVRVSADGGTTWKTVTNNLEEVVTLGHSGTSVILEVTITGNAELEFWGVAA